MKKFLKLAIYLLAFGGLFLFFACNNSTGPGPANSDLTANNHVFVFGNYQDPVITSKWFAYYWEDGSRNDMSVKNAGGTSVHDVAVVNGTRYEAGEYWSNDNPNTDPDEACYWVNEGDCNDICKGCAIAIAATGSDNIYILGHKYEASKTYDKYDYWYCNAETSDSQITLNPPSDTTTITTTNIYPKAIAINGTDVYIVGSYYFDDQATDDGGYKACFWKNGECQTLESEGQARAYDIAIQDGKIYITGQCIYNGTGWNACYWEYTDGNWQLNHLTNINETGHIIDAARADVVTIANNQLYIGGSYTANAADPENIPYKKACYWEPTDANPTATDARYDFNPAVSGDAFVHAIAVSGSTIYGACEYYTHVDQENGNGTICYWTGDKNKTQSLGDVTEICGITVVTQ